MAGEAAIRNLSQHFIANLFVYHCAFYNMIQIGNACKLFEEQTARILSGHADDKEKTSAAEQEEKLQLCKKNMQFENFFFVIDNRSFQAESVNGICNVLGYTDKTFTLTKFFNIIHPTHNMVQLITRYELLETLLKGERSLRFASPVFTSNIALKHTNGGYLLFKWQASPFQLSASNCLLSYFNEFMLISPYTNETCNLRVTDKNGKPVDWSHQLSAAVKRRLHNLGLFSNQELLILTYYALHPLSTNASVAEAFSIKASSVITYNKRILRKAEQSFARRFKTAREVADYLCKENLI